MKPLLKIPFSSCKFQFLFCMFMEIFGSARFDLLVENKDDLAKLMVLEQGKPLAEATGEVI